MSVYEQALNSLSPDTAAEIRKAFAAWVPHAQLGQVVRNIEVETALAQVDFASLLKAFSGQLSAGEVPENAWQTACRQHKMKGRRLEDGQCPSVLGRAWTLRDYAKCVVAASRGSGALSQQEAEKWLIKRSGSRDPAHLPPFLVNAALGRFLIWATFNAADTKAHPFDHLLSSHEAIRTAFGLGNRPIDDTLILLAWSHVGCGSPSLHRPTVADAETGAYYRPHADVNAVWGLTMPLSPNRDRLQPQPEVVMPEVVGKGLRLPFRVVWA